MFDPDNSGEISLDEMLTLFGNTGKNWDMQVRPAPKSGPDVIRKEAWPFYRTISGVRLCWELEQPKGPKGLLQGYLAHKKHPPP